MNRANERAREDEWVEEEEENNLYEYQKLLVDKGQSPIRIDVFLQERMVGVSRNRIQNACKEGRVLVNDNPIKANYKVRPLDTIQVMLSQPYEELQLIPEDLHLDIVYEDEEVILINKPAGMVMHPGHGNLHGTLVNGLMYLKDTWPDINGSTRPGIVHRIDKNTSGIIIAGKTEEALTKLSKQFFDHTIDREYIALVWGDLAEDQGRIVGNIARDPKNRLKFFVDKDGQFGKWAATNYEVIKRYGYVTLIRCKLETGRTHQIRVHLRYIGHPLFNDFTYGGDQIVYGTVYAKYKQFVENCFKLIPSQALHAKSLGFTHPKSGERMLFDVPLPEGFQKIIDKWDTYINHLQSNS